MSLSNSSNITEEPHKLSHEFCIALASYFICLSVTGIVCNSILIYTIFTNTKLHKTGNYLIVNLAICDVITCFNLAFDSHYLLRQENYNSGAFLCAFTKATNLALLPLSIISLLLLTFEKLLSFLYPFRHRDMLTVERICMLLLSTWIYSIATGCFPIMNDVSAVGTENGACYLQLMLPYQLYQLIVNFAIPLLCILLMDIWIFRIAMRSVARSRRLSNGTLSTESQLLTKWRRTRTISTVVANESLCWFSYMIAVAASIACGGCLPQQVPWLMNAINYTSVGTNPLLYGLLNQSVRHSIGNLCRKGANKNFYSTDQMSLSSKYSRASRKSERNSTSRGDRESIRYLFDRNLGSDLTTTEPGSVELHLLKFKILGATQCLE